MKSFNKNSALKLFTVATLYCQLSWYNPIALNTKFFWTFHSHSPKLNAIYKKINKAMIKLLSFSVWSCNSQIKIKQEITVPNLNKNLISPAIPPLNHTWRSQEYKGYDHQLKKLLIVKQIHLVSTLRRIWWTVWRICTLMLGCKELNHCLKRAKEKKI